MTFRSARGGTLVVIPTYDERENIESVVARVLAARPEVAVLVVDDGSPDGTGAIADALARDDERVHVLHRTEKAGLGAAYLAGFAWGLERHHDVLVEMDADGSHRPEELGRLLERCAAGADLVIGSRWVRGGSVVNWPWHRIALSRGGSLYSRIALGVRVRDLTGGYRAIRADLLRSLVAEDIASAGYCFQVDLARRAVRAGAVVAEVPITFVERERGESKMSGGIVVEALVRVTGWGLQRLFRLGSP
ncbi:MULTISPECIES: polyprenol monophosphomannose synthase [Curtobacterium]|uniref:polyprenol monophosphomannose synthase n=1 Tax=Curtobacterium TaxID=2034 RepID=UPI00112661DF|nr:polyprenol monophosphomannose synthase [Curtobacterium flaccumfaciens]MBT1619467.1 polyprenol monophosphomannose synthase [Curtobacterium flaccumfaciens pv. poinsettiae]TPG07767.1 polyprenol monophosphomannose synthase [Curtobacterium flaccumfaciens]